MTRAYRLDFTGRWSPRLKETDEWISKNSLTRMRVRSNFDFIKKSHSSIRFDDHSDQDRIHNSIRQQQEQQMISASSSLPASPDTPYLLVVRTCAERWIIDASTLRQGPAIAKPARWRALLQNEWRFCHPPFSRCPSSQQRLSDSGTLTYPSVEGAFGLVQTPANCLVAGCCWHLLLLMILTETARSRTAWSAINLT